LRLYLEVDGVINAVYGPRSWVGHVAEGQSPDVFDSVTFDGYTFIWSRELVRRLVAWAEQDGNEIVWATSWDLQIETLSRLLGFGRVGADARSLDVTSAPDTLGMGFVTPFSKMRAILEDVKAFPVEGENWVALDSSLSELMDAEGVEWVTNVALTGGDIPPIVAEIGVTPGLMSYIETYGDIDDWIESVTFDMFESLDEDNGKKWEV
jgi:hypothetical protein